MIDSIPINPSLLLVRRNEGRINSEEYLLRELNTRYADTFNVSDEPLGKKNLVYFTINYSVEYIELFLYCLCSIVNKDESDAFDLLVICPVGYENIINELIRDRGIDLKGFNLLFHTVAEAKDGIDASMNKLNLYQFRDIEEYGKVLFLDADIIATAPISELFDLELDNNIFYSAIHSASDHLHNTKFHRLVDYDLFKMNEFRDKGIYAFNAGQYLFVNSQRMRRHFDNVIWLADQWPGEYFFEQAFMNHYFNWFCISDVHLMAQYVKFIVVHLDPANNHFLTNKIGAYILHFAGHACDARKKIEYINKYHSELIPSYVEHTIS